MEQEIVLQWEHKGRLILDTRAAEGTGLRLTEPEMKRLVQPRALHFIARHTAQGAQPVRELNDSENLLIKGNNLLALYSLKRVFGEKIKLIYIDPPYNTGKESFGYNDRFRHSVWLTFMKNRLEAARDLLRPDGSLWINIDDQEAHYLKVVCDEIFGRENFVANVIWQKKFSPQNDARYFSDNHDHILVYAKDKNRWRPNPLPRSEKALARYKNPDNDPRGPWASGDLTVKTYNPACDYPIRTPSGRVINPPRGVCWRVSKQRFEELVADGRIWFGKNGDGVPRLKRFLSEVKSGMTPLTIWTHREVGHNQEAKQELRKALNDRAFFHTPKPERLLKRILEIGSMPGDWVLDFFAGSGTTAAVALKTGRRFIAVEQMDYIREVTLERLKNVARGESSGISPLVGWKGGGSFLFARLMSGNAALERAVRSAQNRTQLSKLLDLLEQAGSVLRGDGFSSARDFREHFGRQNFPKQKELLRQMLTRHEILVPVTELANTVFRIPEEQKRLNRTFYRLG